MVVVDKEAVVEVAEEGFESERALGGCSVCRYEHARKSEAC